MGVDFEDYNNDGWPDVVITDLANQRYALYKNSGDGSFDYATNSTGFGAITLSHSGGEYGLWILITMAGRTMFIAQSHVMDTIEINEPHLHYKEPPALLWNDRGDSFVDVSPGSGEIFSQKMGRPRPSHRLTYDNDGRLDVVVTSNDGPAMGAEE
jgi:hypothetical protein